MYVEFVEFLCMIKVREIVFNNKCGDVFGVGVYVGFCVDYKGMGIWIVCDLYFVIVQDVFVVYFFCGEFYVYYI